MIWGLILSPLIFGIIALFVKSQAGKKNLLLGGALLHLILTGVCWKTTVFQRLWGWLALDSAGLIFLSITSLLFFLVAIYEYGYFKNLEGDSDEEDWVIGIQTKSLFVSCQLFFLSAMTLVVLSQHLGVMWVAIEATTLTSAPLIFFHRNARSLEATWKYLLICSVGIALALLGNFFLSIAASVSEGKHTNLLFNDLVANAPRLNTQWLKAAFILIVVGYGTKMGLAPLHTWLPDAHSESPSPISALLSGALLNCAFLGIFRIYQICNKAGLVEFASDIMIALGVLSLIIAAVFILGQSDYKRLLAYSSVEHMGILAIGVGFGGLGIFGSMLHSVNHSVSKAALFLLSGIILENYHSKKVSEVKGIMNRSRGLGLLWLSGFFAISGSPPFGLFASELTILKAGFEQGETAIAIISLGLLVLIFIGMATVFLNMVQSPAEGKLREPIKLKPMMIYPPALLLIISLILGVHIPGWLKEVLMNIARC